MSPTEVIKRLRELQSGTGNAYYIEAIKAAISIIETRNRP